MANWLISINKLRNLFVAGAVGTVNGRTARNMNTVLEEMMTGIKLNIDNRFMPHSTGVQAAPDVDAGTLKFSPLVHYAIAPVDADVNGVHAAILMGAAAQDVATAITSPDVPRVLTVDGNVAGITRVITITGTNIKNEVITDAITCNGTATVSGAKAFKTVTNINVPAYNNTPVLQVETATAAGTITASGNASVVVTAAGMTGSPKTISVAVLLGDTAAVWAGKVRVALAADADVSALFTVGGTTTAITLTRIAPAVANDATLNIALDNGTCEGITTAASSANTTAGVVNDAVEIGWANVFGMPHIIPNAANLLLKLFDGSTDSGTLAVDADEVEKNLFTINGTPDGAKVLDLYYAAQ